MDANFGLINPNGMKKAFNISRGLKIGAVGKCE